MNKRHGIPTISDYLNAPVHPLRRTGGHAARRRPSRSDLPLVSICTFVLNGALTIRQTIESVRAQTYPNVEYVVIDGVSTDGTVELLRASEDIVDYWISEADRGPADAANKAVAYSTGEFILLLPSNDWISSDFIENAVQTLQRSSADFVFGDVVWYQGDTAEFRHMGDANYSINVLWRLPRIALGASVIRRKRFEELGLFNLGFELSSDTEWLARLHAHGGRGVYDERIFVNFRRGGMSNKHFYRNAKYVRRAFVENGFAKADATLFLLYHIARHYVRVTLQLMLPGGIYQQLIRRLRRSYSRPVP